jgi:hypothetical protein
MYATEVQEAYPEYGELLLSSLQVSLQVDSMGFGIFSTSEIVINSLLKGSRAVLLDSQEFAQLFIVVFEFVHVETQFTQILVFGNDVD